MRVHPALTLFGVLTLLVSGSLLALTAYLFSEEDYQPLPGSLRFYLGLSALVRQAPFDLGTLPAYYGSIGDGNKPAQSQVSIQGPAAQAQAAWQDWERYLYQQGCSRTEARVSGLSPLAAQYLCRDQGLVVLERVTLPGDSAARVSLTHYE
ncbi:MAG: hypothetical protein ABWY06_04455 [Pseudomonas sp.]|uniref:hypothetical protein n=1 Tax=Pseudomonas sp. TaxID=306 RepID=UPI00339A04EC